MWGLLSHSPSRKLRVFIASKRPNGSTFYFSSVAPKDWTSPQNDALWQDAVKSLFDPCPAGWRVPRSGDGELTPWQALTHENGPYIADGNRSGRQFGHPPVTGDQSAWYPATGIRYHETGSMQWIEGDAHFWSSTAYDTYIFRLLMNTITVDPSNKFVRGRGYSVRCIRE